MVTSFFLLLFCAFLSRIAAAFNSPPLLLSEPFKPLFREPVEIPSFQENEKRHEVIKPFLVERFAEKNKELVEKKKELVAAYKAYAEKWKLKAKRSERRKDKVPLKPKPAPTPVAPPVVVDQGRKTTTSSRSRGRYGDAVRSEEELQQILQELLEEERENPEIGYIRTLAVIPPQIIDEDEKARRFSSTNGLVEDSEELEREVKFGHPWSEQEKAIFSQVYLAHPKNFRKIKAHLENKTVEDCVQFYYLNKRTLGLKQLLKQGNRRRRAAQQKSGGTGKSQMLISQGQSQGQGQGQPSNRRRPEGKDGGGGGGGGGGGASQAPQPPTTPRGSQQPQQMEEFPPQLDAPTKWSDQEREKFIEGLSQYGTDFGQVATFVGSKNQAQCKNFFHNNQRRLNLEKILEERAARAEAEEAAESEGDDVDADADPSRPESPLDEGRGGASKGGDRKKPRSKDTKERKPAAVWTDAERDQIVKLLGQHGRKWNLLSQHVKTKTPEQIRNFYQNYKQKLNLDKIALAPPGGGKKKSKDDGDDDDGQTTDLAEQLDMKEFDSRSRQASRVPSNSGSPLTSPAIAAEAGTPTPPFAPEPQQQQPGLLPSFVSPLFDLSKKPAGAQAGEPVTPTSGQN